MAKQPSLDRRPRVLLTRTAPFGVVQEALVKVKEAFDDPHILVLTQEGTERRVAAELKPERTITVGTGFFEFSKLRRHMWRELRAWGPTHAVLVDSGTSGGTFRHWRRFMRLLGIRRIYTYMYSRRALQRQRLLSWSLRNGSDFGKWVYGVGGLLHLSMVLPLRAFCSRVKRPFRLPEARQPIRILYMAHESSLNGSGVSLLQTLAKMDSRRVQPLICTPSEGPLTQACRDLGFTTVVIPTSQLLRQRFDLDRLREDLAAFVHCCPQLIRLIRDRGIQLVHTNTLVVPEAMVAAWVCAVPKVWHFREYLYDTPVWRTLQLHILDAFSDVVIAISDYCRSLVQSVCTEGKVVRIHNGLDPATYSPAVDLDRARRNEGLEEGAFIAGVFGTLMEDKGQHVLLRAMPKLVEAVPNALLLIVGRLPNDRYEQSLRNFVQLQGLDRHIRFLGYREDVRPLMACCNVIVVPSVWDEPFGRVAIEAMAMAKPVIASACGGLKEIVVHGVTGELVSPGAPEEIADSLIKMSRSQSRQMQFGTAGRRRIEHGFDISQTARRIEECYAMLLGRRAPGTLPSPGLAARRRRREWIQGDRRRATP
jgi:glycosyltransferase involved in cell wall biosynthesis